MTVLDLVLYPDERLKTKCLPVADITDEIKTLVQDMVETMYDAPGIGLAAPQIGHLKRITVIDCSGPDDEPNLVVLINPEITSRSGSIVWEEGCLSIPGVFEEVKRAEKVVVTATDVDGNDFEIEADGLEAVCLQHEIDHLDGVLFFDHLSRLKLRMALKTYKRTKEQWLEEQEEKKKKEESPDPGSPEEE